MQKTVLFVNPFSEDFTHTWDKEPYTVKSGQQIYLPDWLAEHLAKHLVDRELNKLGLSTEFKCIDPNDPRIESSRDRLLAKCIVDVDSKPVQNDLKLEVEILNKNLESNQEATSEVQGNPWCDSCDSKGVRHKKNCPKSFKLAVPMTEEFEGLK